MYFWVYGRILARIAYTYMVPYFFIDVGIQTYQYVNHYDDLWANKWLAYAFYPIVGLIVFTFLLYVMWGMDSRLVRRTYREVLVKTYPATPIDTL
jgi:hypothetical protein